MGLCFSTGCHRGGSGNRASEFFLSAVVINFVVVGRCAVVVRLLQIYHHYRVPTGGSHQGALYPPSGPQPPSS